MGVSASGCHHNISLWKGGEDSVKPLGQKVRAGMDEVFSYRSGGDNTFMPEGDDSQLPGQIGQYAIGGITKHLDALTAIGCSTVNSYRRLWDTGFWAPVFKDWGFQNRTTGLRISAPGRFEFRSVDSMVNPYLMSAGLLKAMDDGLENQIPCGKPEERNIYAAIEEGKKVEKLPMSLGAALEALAKDETIKAAMPGEMYGLYDEYKRDEWERFMHTTTNWDVETYLDYLP
jgi:glutamine synthetase